MLTEKELFDKLYWLNRFHTADKICLLNALKEKYGQGVLDVVEEAECKKARQEWEGAAKQCEDHTIETFLKLYWEPLRAKGFEFTSEQTPDGIQMKCTKCPVYEMAKELVAEEWMYHHTCCADFVIASGFNPNIRLKRTKTIMQGDEYCDHFYSYE